MSSAAAAAPSGGRARTAVVLLTGLLALALLVALVWGLGGFRRRTDQRITTAPDTLLSAGPYELTFTSATAQRHQRFDGTVEWQLVVLGSGRTTGDTSIRPQLDDHGMFVAKDPASGEVESASGQQFGSSPSSGDGDLFTPGLAAKPYGVQFDFPATYRPGPSLRLGVFRLDFRDASLLGGEEPTWVNAAQAYDLTLPVRVLPDARS